MRIVLILIAIALIVKSGTCYAASFAANQKWQTFEQEIQPRMDFFCVPGAAVAVVDNGKLVLKKTYGFRDLESRLAADEHTDFQLASISKFIFALAAGTLAEQGRIKWNEPICRYYPSLRLADKYVQKNVSLADFLSHRSGLKRFDGDDLTCFGYSRDEIINKAQYLQLSNFRSSAQYSNIGFLLAGEAVGKIYGSSWEKLVTDKIFRPLGMNESTCRSAGNIFSTAHTKLATPYGYDFELKKNIPLARTDYSTLGPAGSMSSNINDMSSLLLMLTNNGQANNKQILLPETLAEIYQPLIANNTGGPEHKTKGFNAMGCNGFRFNSSTVIEKDGLLNGMAPVICLIPEQNSGIVVLCNTDMTDFRNCVRELFLEYILGNSGRDFQKDYFDSWREECANSGNYSPPQACDTPPPGMPLSAYCGKYHNTCYGEFMITSNGKRLEITAVNNNKQGWLIPQGGDSFVWYWPQNQDEFPMRFLVKNNKVTGASGEWLGYLSKIS